MTGPGTRTAARLADGREIVFFDEHPGPPRTVHDRRELPPVATTSQLRFDPLQREWVAIAGHRQTRTFLPPADRCPLCPTRPGHDSEIPARDYDVVAFENRFPSFAGGPDLVGDRGAELVQNAPGAGRCEVVCFTSDHYGCFAALPVRRTRLVLDALADRTAALSALPGVEQVFCFENRGEEIGVTLHHPHGQIYGYPFVTPRTARQLDAAREHRDRTGRDLFADVLAQERAGARVVARRPGWTAYVPGAARWPVEVHVMAHRAVPDLPALRSGERDALADLLHEVFGRLDRLYPTPLPYLACWFQAPVRVGRELARLHLQVLSPKRSADKLKYLAGSESGMGVFVSDVAPEDVAARLRQVSR